MARGRRLFRLKHVALDAEAAAKYLLDLPAEGLRRDPAAYPPLSSAALFGNDRPLEVDIGTGTGEYVVELARQDGESNYLGIEVSRRLAAYAAALAARHGLENLRILRANFSLLRPLLPAGAWQRASLHFPDPVHKRKDEKRHIFNPAFLDALAHVLAPGGELSIASDKHDFFLGMLALAEQDTRFVKAHPQAYLEGLQSPHKSRFQQFWERKGVTPLQVVLRKHSD
ncbi:MAG: tRNA (guanosine(46)-N7)-methyltransferase TrmB [Anaerolineales bacterium]|nr:tRNA (guanosine(46)-N7)-methyltransferase TrmB [Anaerolineales bacterium]